MLLLGRVGGIGAGWFAMYGKIELLIASLLLVPSSCAETRMARACMLTLFEMGWLVMDMVSAALSNFAVVKPTGH